jgi:hypothetical protein
VADQNPTSGTTELFPAMPGAAGLPDISRPSLPNTPPPSPLATVGVSGTVVTGGYILEQEKSPELAGLNRYRTFSDTLTNVSIVAAGTRYFLNLVSKPLWKLDPNDHPDSARYAELVESMMYGAQAQDTPWHRIVRRAATYRFYGFSVQEWTARQRPDGLIGMEDISARPQSTIEQWDRDEQGRVYNILQRSPTTGKLIRLPRWKTIYVVDDSVSDSPEGLGLFRHIAESVRRLRRYEQLEGWGFETDLRGIPVARAPLAALQELKTAGTLTQAQFDKAIAGLTKFLQGHVRAPNLGIMLDSITYEDRETRNPSSQKKWDIELLRADANSQPEVLKAIDRLNREIARVLGVEQLLLGDNGIGSFAMAKEKNHNFAIVIDATLEELREAFQRDWLGPIFRLNGWPLEAMPEIKTDKLQFRNIDDVTNALQRMATAGAPLMPDDPAINELRDLLGLSHPTTVPSPEDLGLLPGRWTGDPNATPVPQTPGGGASPPGAN